ncbi:gamma-aminobutyric acid type B receptor subunit 1 [Trichonephila clavipes]|nr:gamma-aminobutyric acid type B receptor subunit 1 [Trichonephila clavipes]
MVNGFELRATGGSAIYRNLQSSTNCSEIIVNANKSCGNTVLRKHNVGDICLVDVKVEDLTLFILGAVYIHPKASAEAKLCLYQSLLPYSANLTKLIPNSQPDLETPIVLCGDFNCDPQQNSYLVEFMKNEFGLNYIQKSPTTLGNTTIAFYATARNPELMTPVNRPKKDGTKKAVIVCNDVIGRVDRFNQRKIP